MKKAEVYYISTGQYQSSSGLLGKTTKTQKVIIIIIIIIIMIMIMIMIIIIIIIIIIIDNSANY